MQIVPSMDGHNYILISAERLQNSDALWLLWMNCDAKCQQSVNKRRSLAVLSVDNIVDTVDTRWKFCKHTKDCA